MEDFLLFTARNPIKPEIEIYLFEKANEASLDLKNKHIKGVEVLQMGKYLCSIKITIGAKTITL